MKVNIDTLTSKFYIGTILTPTDTHPIHFSDGFFIPPIKNKRGLVSNPKCNVVFLVPFTVLHTMFFNIILWDELLRS